MSQLVNYPSTPCLELHISAPADFTIVLLKHAFTSDRDSLLRMTCGRVYFHPLQGKRIGKSKICFGTDAEHGMRLAAGAFMKGQQMRGSQTPAW